MLKQCGLKYCVPCHGRVDSCCFAHSAEQGGLKYGAPWAHRGRVDPCTLAHAHQTPPPGWFKVWRPVGGSHPGVEDLPTAKQGGLLLSGGGKCQVLYLVAQLADLCYSYWDFSVIEDL